MIIQVTYRCDWPGCQSTVTTCNQEYLRDHGWERRGTNVVCETHKSRTSRELMQEQLNECMEREFFEEWGFLL